MFFKRSLCYILLPMAIFGLWFSKPTQAQTNYVVDVPNSWGTGIYNTIVGPNAGSNNTSGYYNAFFGAYAGNRNTSGYFNAFVGYYSGHYNTTGNYNTFMGHMSGYSNTYGVSNVFMGTYAGQSCTLGSYNVFAGTFAGNLNTTGNNLVAIGYQAGQRNTIGINNTFIGAGADASVSNLINSAAIGYNARVSVSNALVLGDPTNTSLNVGIGTDSPRFPLDVQGIINLGGPNGRLKFSSLSNPGLRHGYTDQFLTVDEKGETVLARYRIRVETPHQWSDRVFASSYRLRSLKQVAQYVQMNQHLPGVPSAQQMTSEGMDATLLASVLLEKIEELTLYVIEQQDQITKQQLQINTLRNKNMAIKPRLHRR